MHQKLSQIGNPGGTVTGGEVMKIMQALLASFLLLASTAPARADFKYAERRR